MRISINRARAFAASVAIVAATGVGIAAAATAAPTPSNGTARGVGINEFGMTQSFLNGKVVSFDYTKGFYCDKHVGSFASSGCEVGAPAKVPAAPLSKTDPLYITVPLGFNVPTMSLECPAGLACVDHPGTIDLTRLESALKGLYPTLTNAQLTNALKNFATPGHEHFITTNNNHQAEWWPVFVVGVTSHSEWNTINQHRSYAFLKSQVDKKLTTGIIPTNLYLYFDVK